MSYDTRAPKRPVNMSLNEDLVRRSREFAGNLSEQVERLLAAYVLEEQKRRDERNERLDAAIDAWNDFDARHGSFADDHVDL